MSPRHSCLPRGEPPRDPREYSSVFRRIADCPLPLVMYGTGDGAERITRIIKGYGREIELYFSSDDFFREERIFMGKPVVKYSDVCRVLGDFAVILGFGSARADVVRNIRRIAAERVLIAPDISPVRSYDSHDDYLTMEAFIAAREKVDALTAALADDRSRRLFSAMISYRLSGDISYLDGTAVGDPYLWLYHSPMRYDTAADLGADRGESSLEMLMRFPELKRVIAVEPDEASFRRLGRAVVADRRIETYRRAVSHISGEIITMSSDGSRGTSYGRAPNPARGAKNVRVVTAALDDLVGGGSCELIHIDVEGMERAAIRGASKVIERCRPDMMVSVYHRQPDLWEIPLLLHSLLPEKRLHLVRPDALPPWDIICVAEG